MDNKICKICISIFLGTDTLQKQKMESFNSGAFNTEQIHFIFTIFYGIE